MQNLQRYLAPLVFAAADYLAITIALLLALIARDAVGDTAFSLPRIYLWLWIPLIYIVFLCLAGAYDRRRPSLDIYRDTFKANVGATVISIVMLYLLRVDFSRAFLITQFVAVALALLACRYLVATYLKRHRLLTERALLIGAGLTAERVIRYFDTDCGYNYDIVGILDDSPHPVAEGTARRYGLLGGLKDAPRLVKKLDIKTVIITAPGLEKSKLQRLIATIQPHVRSISFVPDLIGTPMGSVDVDNLFSEEIMLLRLKNNLARRRSRAIKRAFDLFCTIITLPLTLPILGIIALVVKIGDGGAICYNAARIGQHGREFICYKFQTMYPNSDEILENYLADKPDIAREWHDYAKLKGYDPRVTRVGAFLRKTSLDELPQLLNVIKGDMSLVGPRPYLPREKADIGGAIREITLVHPGITGMWQTSGRSDTTFAERVAMDTWYVRNWSIWIDLMYLLKTFKIVLTGKGAY